MLHLLIASVAVVLAAAASPLQSYNLGNKFYAQKDYAGAVQAYEEALKAGASADVHYNLGNALFKTGKIGKAIVNYRRARYLDPTDHDIASNLEFARSYRVDKGLAVQSPFARAMDTAFHRLSRRAAAVLAAVACLLAGLLFAVWIVQRWRALGIGAAMFALVALFGFVTQQMWATEMSERPAVVIMPEVSALSGPSDDFKQILLVHDGTEVRIRETRGDYLLVQLPGGGGGWLRKEAVERIYP